MSLVWWFASDKTVTVRSLLEEMTDREETARFPQPAYTSQQFSSYDQKSVSPNQPGWYANTDYNWFLRPEINGLRRENVMLET